MVDGDRTDFSSGPEGHVLDTLDLEKVVLLDLAMLSSSSANRHNHFQYMSVHLVSAVWCIHNLIRQFPLSSDRLPSLNLMI